MDRQNFILYRTESGPLRSVIKTNHGRLIFIELAAQNDTVYISQCYYLDRSKRPYSPLKLVTRVFLWDDLLTVIARELDRSYFGVKITNEFASLANHEFITLQLKNIKKTYYNFFICVGEGEVINGIPSVIKSRFKNRIHRSIYIEMQYQKGKGVITDCHYYDRKYKKRSKVIPETLTTVFFEYTRNAILNIINNELGTCFTDVIFITDGSIDIDKEVALCGNI